MTREPTDADAVNEPGLRKLLAKGWHLVVLCHETPSFRSNHWYGNWTLRIARPDGAEERRLVLSRAPFEERRFSTLSTVVKFLAKYDFATSHIPLKPGGRAINVPPTGWVRD